jgi:hypothetical protein
MKSMMVASVLLLGVTVVQAQSAPDLKGTWTGKGKSVVFGSNPHHPGTAPNETTPRIRDYEFTFVVTGQEGSLLWGYNFSSVSATHEPFAWAIAGDGRTIVGADTDGSYRITVMSADRLELCYTHSGLGPSKSIVATCAPIERKK